MSPVQVYRHTCCTSFGVSLVNVIYGMVKVVRDETKHNRFSCQICKSSHLSLKPGLVTCPNFVTLQLWKSTAYPIETVFHLYHRSCLHSIPSLYILRILTKLNPWPGSARELYRPSDRRMSSKLVPILADRGFYVASFTDPYGCILGFLERSRYFFFQVAPQLYSRGSVDLVPDPRLLRKSGSAGNRTRTSGSVARNSNH
jgi:hypothetical protein